MVAAAIVGGAAIGAVASRSGSKRMASSADRATDAAMEQYYQTREDQEPWREAGLTALNRLQAGLDPGGEFDTSRLLTNYKEDPGYQFRLNAGSKLIEGSALARGGLLSGGTLKALTRYGQDYASNEFDKIYNREIGDRFTRLSSIANYGTNANTTNANAGANASQQAGSAMMTAGQAQAAGYTGVSNAINSGVSSYINYNQSQTLLDMLKNNRSYTGGTSSLSTINGSNPLA